MKHLNDDELASAIAGLELAPDAGDHLSTCLSCKQQVAAVQKAVDDRRTGFEARAPDWQAQHLAVMSRLASASRASKPVAGRWLRPVLAAAAAIIVAVGLRLSMPPADVAPPVSDDLPIEQILAEVDAVLADDALPGFEPIDPGFDDPESLFENGAS